MKKDARYADGGEQGLRLKAMDAEDLRVISSLVQDAVFPATGMRWNGRTRQFALLVNRFRWESAEDARLRKRPFERVRSIIAVEDAGKVSSMGIDRKNRRQILSLLSLEFEAGEDGTGKLAFALSGDCAIAVHVEALEVTLKDVEPSYPSRSGRAPTHPD